MHIMYPTITMMANSYVLDTSSYSYVPVAIN